MQNIQTATMRHADNGFAQTKLVTALEDLFNRRNHRFGAIHAKPLGASIFLMQIAFEFFGINQTFIDRLLAFDGKIRAVADGFDTFLNPCFLRRILNMHEFDANRTTIGFAQHFDDFAQSCRFQTQHIIDENRTIPIIFIKAIGLWIKFRMQFRLFECQRVKLGKQMPANTIGTNQHHRAQ